MAERRIGLDRLAHSGIEGASGESERQDDAEYPQQAADLVLEVDARALHHLAARQKRSHVVALDALHMHPAVPPRSEDLGDAAGVVLVRLVAHGRKRGRDLTRFHADDVVASLRQSVGDGLCQRAGLKSSRHGR